MTSPEGIALQLYVPRASRFRSPADADTRGRARAARPRRNVNYYYSLASFGAHSSSVLGGAAGLTSGARLAVVFYYDYALTLHEEIRFFWRPKRTMVAVFFFVNRYLSVFGNVPVILQSFAIWTPKASPAFCPPRTRPKKNSD